MRSIALAIMAGTFIMPAFAETVKLTVERGGVSRVYAVEAGQSRSFSDIRTIDFASTSGDCTKFDTSKLHKSANDGDALRVFTSKAVDGVVFVSFEYEHHKFLGTTAHKLTEACTVNNPSSHNESFGPSFALRQGDAPLLASQVDEVKVTAVIEK